MPTWTEEQLQGITAHGKNIIVSAGAGSGKTAVLTERIIRELASGVKLNELLVLTFTNAAASEMKERVRKALKKNKDLTESLDLLDAAYITTFDAFALSIVKKYHYLLNISPDVSIIETSVINLKKREFLDEVMNEYYISKPDNFTKLINDFCVKDDTSLKNMILKINSKLDLIYDKRSLLNTYLDKHYSEEYIKEIINKYLNLIMKKKELLQDNTDKLRYLLETDVYNIYYELLEPLLSSDSYDIIKSNLDFKLPALPKGSSAEVKKVKEKISDLIKELKELCRFDSITDCCDDIIATKPYVTIIIDIISSLDKRISDYKYKYDMYEFNDIAVFAIKIVSENIEVRNELTNSFYEILVDEYQDTSDLQELFIKTISNNNIYMVGDLKQSIYRFRNANPLIFKEKYDMYKQEKKGMKIDFTKNFRSRNTVIDSINLIFDLIMDDDLGGASYKEEHELVYGNHGYTEIGATEQNMNLEIYNYEYTKDCLYSKGEIEAFMIADDISNKVKNKYQVYDKDNNCLRIVTYRDFAILIDNSKEFDLYKQIFTYKNIPLITLKDSVLTSSTIVLIIKSILNMLISTTHDAIYVHAYMSVARSILFEIKDEDIFKTIESKTFEDTIIGVKIANIKKQMSSLKATSILKLVIEEFNIYEEMIKLGNIHDNLERIDYLSTLAQTLSNMGYDIKQFTNYINDIFNNTLDIKYAVSDNDSDAVKLMTIHKSKGLEFYICYFPNMYHSFNIKDASEHFSFSPTYGFITPVYKEGIYNTIYTDLLKDEYISNEISEKLRLFYVALTRAKEKMIIICDLNTPTITNKVNGVVSVGDRLDYRSFKDILLSVKDDCAKLVTNKEITDLNLTKDYKANIKKIKQLDINTTNIVVKEIDIDNNEIVKEVFSHKQNNLLTYEESLLLEAGNHLHYILEILDFQRPNVEDLPINANEKQAIYNFLHQSIMDDIKDATVYKEYEFVYTVNDILKHGIIDLMLVYKDYIKIIDYKLNNIDNPLYIEQLNGYKTYIEEITNKTVKIYLYSIIKAEVKEV